MAVPLRPHLERNGRRNVFEEDLKVFKKLFFLNGRPFTPFSGTASLTLPKERNNLDNLKTLIKKKNLLKSSM